MSFIQENLTDVRERIRRACEAAGRNPDEVTLIAVSKTKPVSAIREVMEAGVKDFGENKPQELRDKYEEIGPGLSWHMIGHLQRNKLKYIIDKVCMIHSVDTPALAEDISAQAVKRGLVIPVLIEVNMTGEESKFGVRPEEAEAFVRAASVLPGIHIRGLMTIAPYVENPEENRVYFRRMRELSIDIARKNIDNVDMIDLSMGMTGDFETAIEEGATYVRVGTGIFGERDYSRR